jgi:hypothetical protein
MGILEKGGPWQPWMEIKSGNMMEHDHCVKLGCVFVVVFFLGGFYGLRCSLAMLILF